MFVVDDIAIAAASEIAAEAATEIATEIAEETVTEVASEVATEAASEIATEAVSEMATEAVSEMATETVSEMTTEATSEMATEVTSELPDEILSKVSDGMKELIPDAGDEFDVTPESIINPSEISEIKDFETNIIGDNIGETYGVELPDNLSDIQDGSPRTIKTINDGLVGQCHPDTGVPYVEKEIITDTGEEVEGVFPQFESKFDIQLPQEIQQAPDRTQFAECNHQLKEKIDSDIEFRSQFTEDQLADINDGYTPEGYTWHHNEEIGKMQLVDSDIHSQTRHTGGRYIWGGGTENRH